MDHSPAPSRERATSPKGDGGAAGAVSTSPGAGVVETVEALAPPAGPATHVSCSAGFSFLLLRVRAPGEPYIFLMREIRFQPVLRSLSSIGKMYLTLERHRDQLLEEKNAAVDKVEDLERRLAAMKRSHDEDLKQAKLEIQSREDKIEGCKKALEKVKSDAVEREKGILAAAASREEELEGRLRALVEALSGTLFICLLIFLPHLLRIWTKCFSLLMQRRRMHLYR